MDANTIASIVNLGAAGAVIIVVGMFLRSIKERDAEWRDFFTTLNANNCADAEKRLVMTESILELVKAILSELKEHDEKVDKRIADASKSTLDAVAKSQRNR